MIVRCELRFKQKLIGFKQYSDIDFTIAYEDYKLEELGLEVEDQQDYDTIQRLCALYRDQEVIATEKNHGMKVGIDKTITIGSGKIDLLVMACEDQIKKIEGSMKRTSDQGKISNLKEDVSMWQNLINTLKA